MPPTHTSSSSGSASNTPSSESVSVKAYYIAQRINLAHVHANVYGTKKKSRQEQKSVTFEIDKEKNQYVTVFKYGSIVFFNVAEQQHQVHLTNIRKSAVVTPISSSVSSSTTSDVASLTEDYKIIVNPTLDRPSVVKAEHVNIRSLNSNNIAIISTVMAQSVALDYYAGLVEHMLEAFLKMTVKVEERGSFHELKMPELYQLVAANNRIFGAVLSKLGIFEGSDAAWDNADYFDTWEGK
jgi:uncharacterized Rmd1/YagE family protein